jgi:hypothetical protein
MAKNRGPIVILLLFASAAGIAGFSIWYTHAQSYRVIQALSSPVTQLIAFAPQAEIMQLAAAHDEPAGDGINAAASQPDIIRIQNQAYKIVQKKNAIGLDRFAELRHWLLHNDNYDWNAAPPANATWQFLLVFTDGTTTAQLAFNFEQKCLVLAPDGAVLNIAPMQEGVQAFFTAQFSPENSAAETAK